MVLLCALYNFSSLIIMNNKFIEISNEGKYDRQLSRDYPAFRRICIHANGKQIWLLLPMTAW